MKGGETIFAFFLLTKSWPSFTKGNSNCVDPIDYNCFNKKTFSSGAWENEGEMPKVAWSKQIRNQTSPKAEDTQ